MRDFQEKLAVEETPPPPDELSIELFSKNGIHYANLTAHYFYIETLNNLETGCGFYQVFSLNEIHISVFPTVPPKFVVENADCSRRVLSIALETSELDNWKALIETFNQLTSHEEE